MPTIIIFLIFLSVIKVDDLYIIVIRKNRKRFLYPGHEAGQVADDWFHVEVEKHLASKEEPIARPKTPLSDVPAEKLVGLLARAEQLAASSRDDLTERIQGKGEIIEISNTIEMLQEH